MFPEKIENIVKNTTFTVDDVGRSRDVVYTFENKYVLKVSDNKEELSKEMERFDYLTACGIPGSRSICFAEKDGKYYYLRTYICGDSLIDKRFINSPELLTDVLVKVVAVLRSLDGKDCPFNSSDNCGNDFVHGDLCLPNIYVDKNNEFAGFIDLGNAGLGDRWYDYSWLLWSLEYNLGTDKYNNDLLCKLGIAYNDDKFKMYIPEKYRDMHFE